MGRLSRAIDLGLDAFRRQHIEERVRRAIEREGVAGADELVSLLRSDAAARERFRLAVAVSVTAMFRDPEQFQLLERDILPDLLAGGRRITVWSAGCADGSELSSIGVLLERLGALERAVLLGSDLLAENVAVARRAGGDGSAVPRQVSARTRWEVRDLTTAGPPAGRWRLILCRNVAIYLAPAARAALNRTLADALAPGGMLLLGRSERLADPAALGLERCGPHVYRKLR